MQVLLQMTEIDKLKFVADIFPTGPDPTVVTWAGVSFVRGPVVKGHELVFTEGKVPPGAVIYDISPGDPAPQPYAESSRG